MVANNISSCCYGAVTLDESAFFPQEERDHAYRGELFSQMLFNFVGGVIQSVGENHVDIGLRGTTVIDQIFESTTYVDEIENVCN